MNGISCGKRPTTTEYGEKKERMLNKHGFDVASCSSFVFFSLLCFSFVFYLSIMHIWLNENSSANSPNINGKYFSLFREIRKKKTRKK